MYRTRILDDSRDAEIAAIVHDVLADEDYAPEEIIPGLIYAVLELAETTASPEASLDEAANLLADGLGGS